MTYWHCERCNHALPEWDAACPRCYAEANTPFFPNVLIPILITLALYFSLFL